MVVTVSTLSATYNVFFLCLAGPIYPPNPAPYSQAAFSPNQPAYPAQPPAQPSVQPPVQPPVQPQPTAPFAHTDFLSQPAYNPDFVGPKTG